MTKNDNKKKLITLEQVELYKPALITMEEVDQVLSKLNQPTKCGRALTTVVVAFEKAKLPLAMVATVYLAYRTIKWFYDKDKDQDKD